MDKEFFCNDFVIKNAKVKHYDHPDPFETDSTDSSEDRFESNASDCDDTYAEMLFKAEELSSNEDEVSDTIENNSNSEYRNDSDQLHISTIPDIEVSILFDILHYCNYFCSYFSNKL